MRILILGGDGYLGWPMAMHLACLDHDVTTIDNYAKRQWEAECDVVPLIPISLLQERVRLWNDIHTFKKICFRFCDIAQNRALLYKLFDTYKPEVVIHFAEQPSAPYSQMNAGTCINTQVNNVTSTLNVIMAILHTDTNCHLIKLGTMGEYGTPNIDIEEGWLNIQHNDREDRVLFPKKPGSWYHLSKVHDSHNLEYATRVYGLRVTDLNQGIVYGIDTDCTWLAKGLNTSFHYDAIFGTVLNRFLAQAAINKPLTVYGAGTQIRGYLNIKDTLACITLAIENPGEKNELRIMNQFTEQFSINELATIVSNVTGATIQHIPNPRVEQEEHYFNAKHTALTNLGLEPNLLTDVIIEDMYKIIEKYIKWINPNSLMPCIKWRNV